MRIRITIGLMGAPEDFLMKAMKKVEDKIKSEREIYSINYEKPKKVGDKYFQNFFEAEIEVKDIEDLMGFVLDYGPDSLEILETGSIKCDPVKIQGAANDVSATMHQLTKHINMLRAQLKIMQRQMLEQKVKTEQKSTVGTKEKLEKPQKSQKAKLKPKTKKKAKKNKGNK